MTRLTKCLVDTANQASTTLTDANLPSMTPAVIGTVSVEQGCPVTGTAYGHAQRLRRPGTNMVFVVP
jgi:hypothetical protein